MERQYEDERIQELVNTDWLSCGGGSSKGSGKVIRRAQGGRPSTKPPMGYICHRCHVGGHFIKHCPTNGDTKYDTRKVKAPSGIPKSMLITNPEGHYVLSGGEAAVLKPNEEAFEKDMEGMPSKRPTWSVHDVPQDLLCPLCKNVMKDAMLTSKCCFRSFCDKCIRDHLINSKLKCECGATDILTDYLIPNMTVRRAINRILECSTSSSGGSGSDAKSISLQVQDLGSVDRCPSQTNAEDRVDGLPQMAMKAKTASQESVGVSDEEVQQKLVCDEIGKKRKRNASLEFQV
ncbi:unnamed protein product [Dovyalis caffra]|uniref:Zinc knuckle CX2CX3GHX4C domain-containing protein n=1 Tax=Dovyalis caffra TaxID=77055 RepID=A0AAV1QPS0_9ROSI|nr:unnamed protein product [Dovyalis caffra]